MLSDLSKSGLSKLSSLISNVYLNLGLIMSGVISMREWFNRAVGFGVTMFIY